MNADDRKEYEAYVMEMLPRVSIQMKPTKYGVLDLGFVEQEVLFRLNGEVAPILGTAKIIIPWEWIKVLKEIYGKETENDDIDYDDYDDKDSDGYDGGDDNDNDCPNELPPSLWGSSDLWKDLGL